jgi:hypothetical protein
VLPTGFEAGGGRGRGLTRRIRFPAQHEHGAVEHSGLLECAIAFDRLLAGHGHRPDVGAGAGGAAHATGREQTRKQLRDRGVGVDDQIAGPLGTDQGDQHGAHGPRRSSRFTPGRAAPVDDSRGRPLRFGEMALRLELRLLLLPLRGE